MIKQTHHTENQHVSPPFLKTPFNNPHYWKFREKNSSIIVLGWIIYFWSDLKLWHFKYLSSWLSITVLSSILLMIWNELKVILFWEFLTASDILGDNFSCYTTSIWNHGLRVPLHNAYSTGKKKNKICQMVFGLKKKNKPLSYILEFF